VNKVSIEGFCSGVKDFVFRDDVWRMQAADFPQYLSEEKKVDRNHVQNLNCRKMKMVFCGNGVYVKIPLLQSTDVASERRARRTLG
jgi:hypothetical protein